MHSGETPDSRADETPHKNRTTKGERQAIRLASMSRWKAGQSGNPLGMATPRMRAWQTFRDYMEGRSDFSEDGDSNIHVVLRAATLTAVMGDSHAQTSLIEAYLRSQVDPLKLAEHFREVAKDRADLALRVLGDTLKSKKPDEVAAIFRAFADNPKGFLDAAEAHIRGDVTPADGSGDVEKPAELTAVSSQVEEERTP